MIIAGNCLLCSDAEEDIKSVVDTAKSLIGIAAYFRCKVVGGGTTPEKYKEGIGFRKGIEILESINSEIPTGTEVHTLSHVEECRNLSFVWVGARNSQNYTLLEHLKYFPGEVFIKRGIGMTVEETSGIYRIMTEIHNKPVHIIERGIVNINGKENSRWSISLNDVLYFKFYHSELFENLIIDCSHSAGRIQYVPEIYKSTKAIGCKKFMIECTKSGLSQTDQNHMISVSELEHIIKGE